MTPTEAVVIVGGLVFGYMIINGLINRKYSSSASTDSKCKNMKCGVCGKLTQINWGDSRSVLCESCSSVDDGTMPIIETDKNIPNSILRSPSSTLDTYSRDKFFCTKCGAGNTSGARFCQECGAPLAHNMAPSTELPNSDKTSHVTSSIKEAHMPLVGQPNFIVRHWRGDYSLGFSYWVIGTLLTVIMVSIITAAGQSSGLQNLGPRVSGTVILTFYGFALTLTLWQLVGIWRSADKHTQRGGISFWAGIAKVMVVLGLMRAVVDFNIVGIPLITEGTKLFVGIDDTPPHTLHLLRDGTELELTGGLPFGVTDEVKKFLDAAPTIRVIHLNSQGGRISEAYKLYKLIKERNLITYTSSKCVSACSIAFLAGRERYLGDHGRLGFHSASIGDLGGDIIPDINDDIRQTLRAHGVPNSFIDRALSTSPEDMWYPSTDLLLEANIINSVVDSRYFGLSGIAR